jgi:hypothetical protein
MNIYEKATRWKLRYATPLGPLTTEDLWDLPLLITKRGEKACLNDLAKTLNKELKSEEEVDFVVVKEDNKELRCAFEVVKHIIEVKIRERDAAEKARETKATKAKMLEILADKEMEDLRGKTADELRGLIAEM